MKNQSRINAAFVYTASAMIMMVMSHPAHAQKTVLGIDCSQVSALHIDKQSNLRAAAIRVGCGLEPGGRSAPPQPSAPLPPAVAGNVSVITGESASDYPHVTQTSSVVWSSNGATILVAYNDSADSGSSPVNDSGLSYSLDEEDLRWARRAATETERKALLELARHWMHAAMWRESAVAVTYRPPEHGAL